MSSSAGLLRTGSRVGLCTAEAVVGQDVPLEVVVEDMLAAVGLCFVPSLHLSCAHSPRHCYWLFSFNK